MIRHTHRNWWWFKYSREHCSENDIRHHLTIGPLWCSLTLSSKPVWGKGFDYWHHTWNPGEVGAGHQSMSLSWGYGTISIRSPFCLKPPPPVEVGGLRIGNPICIQIEVQNGVIK